MWFIFKGIATNALCSGVSLWLGLPSKVASMIDYALTDIQSIGIALMMGGIVSWPIIYFFENGLKNPFENSYVEFDQAVEKIYNAHRQKFKNKKDKRGLRRYDVYPYIVWRGYPLFGTAEKSNVIEPMHNLDSDFVPWIKEGGKEVLKAYSHEGTGYDKFYMKKSDMKKCIRDLLNEKQ